MLFNIFLIVTMMGSVIAAPWKGDTGFNATSSGVHSSIVNTRLSSAPQGLSSTTNEPLGSMWSSLGPLSGSVPASISSKSAPASFSSPKLSTDSPIMSLTRPAFSNLSRPGPSATSALLVTTQLPFNTTLTVVIPGFATLTITDPTNSLPFSSHNAPHTGPLSGIAPPTTMQTSTMIKGSGVTSSSVPHGPGLQCAKDDITCPKLNNTQGADNSSGPDHMSSNDYRVDVVVNGGHFKGGKPFNVSGSYFGNCTSGWLRTEAENTFVREPCNGDLFCMAGRIMADLGAIVTLIMSPTPPNTSGYPDWCAGGIGVSNSSTMGGAGGAAMLSSACTSATMMSISGAASMAPHHSTAASALSGTETTPRETLVPTPKASSSEPLLNSISSLPEVVGTAIPTPGESMVTDTGLPTLPRRSVGVASSENPIPTSNESILESALSEFLSSAEATVTSQSASESRQTGWSEWRTAHRTGRPMGTHFQRAVATTDLAAASSEAAAWSSALSDLLSQYSHYESTVVTGMPIRTVDELATSNIEHTSVKPGSLNPITFSSRTFQTAAPTALQSALSGEDRTVLNKRSVTKLPTPAIDERAVTTTSTLGSSYWASVAAHINPTVASDLSAWLATFPLTLRDIPTSYPDYITLYTATYSLTTRTEIDPAWTATETYPGTTQTFFFPESTQLFITPATTITGLAYKPLSIVIDSDIPLATDALRA